jgi:hypothetical protein
LPSTLKCIERLLLKPPTIIPCVLSHPSSPRFSVVDNIHYLTSSWIISLIGRLDKHGDEDEGWEDVFEDEGDEGDDHDESDDHDEGSDDDNVEVSGELGPSDLASDIEYPHPIHSLAMTPTCTKLCGSDLAEVYGTRDLLPALKAFLGAAPRGQRLFLLGSDTFNVWHKVTLNHLPLSFAANESLQRDVIRAQPAIPDGRGGMRRQSTFDTVLFLNDPDAFGLHRKFHSLSFFLSSDILINVFLL